MAPHFANIHFVNLQHNDITFSTPILAFVDNCGSRMIAILSRMRANTNMYALLHCLTLSVYSLVVLFPFLFLLSHIMKIKNRKKKKELVKQIGSNFSIKFEHSI